MKGLLNSIILIFITSTLSFASNSNMDYDKTKRMEHSYPLSSASLIEIENKYGDVEVEVWDKDSIRFEIEIIVHSDKEEELDGMLNMIKVDIKANSAFILATTNWSEEVGLFKKGFLKIDQEVSKNARYKVNYKITLPITSDLSINNKFGDVYLSSYHGNLDIELAYGDLRAHELSNVRDLNVKFGKVRIKKMPQGRVTLGSVKSFNIDEARELEIESSSSEINIGEIEILTIKSSHDEIDIEKVKELKGTSSMSDITVQELSSKTHLLTRYGSVRFKDIDIDAERLYLEGVKTDFQFDYSVFFKCNVDITLKEESSFTYHSSFKLESSVDEGDEVKRIKGFIHEDSDTKLVMKCENGYIQFDEK